MTMKKVVIAQWLSIKKNVYSNRDQVHWNKIISYGRHFKNLFIFDESYTKLTLFVDRSWLNEIKTEIMCKVIENSVSVVAFIQTSVVVFIQDLQGKIWVTKSSINILISTCRWLKFKIN